ncbi:MAG: DUF5694 domain-containing protein [Sphingomonadales bacterium]
MRRLAITLLLTLATAVSAKPAFDPRTMRGAIAGPPSQVLVLGSPHLSQLPPGFKPEMLAPLLDRLAAFRPEIITVENLSGPECEVLLRYKPVYDSAWDDYCWAADAAEKATGLTVPQATITVRKTLAAWPAAPTAADRRRLASQFLAANDRASAQVQWLRLSASERRTGDGLDTALVDILQRKSAKSNETYDVAVALAVRLGLERIYLTDDHTADSIVAGAPQAYGDAVQGAWKSQGIPPVRAEYERRSKSLTDSTALLDFYRFLNAPNTQRASVATDMGAASREQSVEHWGRQYLAWWEVRNLRMVANIRASFGAQPGARVLSIVGATHKPYFDAYLDLMSDVTLVDTETVLR